MPKPPQATTQSEARERLTQAQRRQRAEERIITAAISIIAERGLQHLTLAAAGEGAGYSRSITSHHFGKKDALLVAICRHITSSFSQHVFGLPPKPGLSRIEEIVRSYFAGAKHNSTRIRALHLILTEAVSSPLLKQALAEVNNNSVSGIEQQIKKGMELGEIRSNIDAHALAVLILAALRGVMAQHLIDKNAVDLDQLREHFLHTLRRTLQA
jgi:AcrR family transcriptional regulator